MVTVKIKSKYDLDKQPVWFKIFNYTLFAALAIVMVYPFWYALLCSVTPYTEIMNKTMPLIVTKLDFSAYTQLFEEKILNQAYKVTFFTTLAGLASSMVFTIMGAYVLSIEKLPGRKFIMMTIMITMFFSGGIIPMYVLLSSLKLTNTYAVYILPTLINTFYMLIIRTAFRELPESLSEAAEIDGCNHLQLLIKIFIPLSLATIAVIALFTLVDKWNELHIALFYVTDYKKMTLQATLYSMFSVSDSVSPGGSGDSISLVSEQVKYAAVMITILPIIFIYPFLQKYFNKGVLIGSIKE